MLSKAYAEVTAVATPVRADLWFWYVPFLQAWQYLAFILRSGCYWPQAKADGSCVAAVRAPLGRRGFQSTAGGVRLLPQPVFDAVEGYGRTNGTSHEALSTKVSPSQRQPVLGERTLRDLLQEEGITAQQYFPGQHRLHCNRCNGGSTGEKSLSLNIDPSGRVAKWVCHRATCGWQGAVGLDQLQDPSSPSGAHLFPLRAQNICSCP